MAEESLCIGDHVCLYSEEYLGYVYSLQTSSIHSEVAVYQKQNRDRPDVPDPQVISFEVCAANVYKLNKRCRKLQAKFKAQPDNLSLKKELHDAKHCAIAENEDNKKEQNRERGKTVVYGQVIQLKHVFTGKYLHVSTTQTSRTEISSMQVNLLEYNAKHAQFRILPRYKVKAEGDVVHVQDQVVFESIKSPGQYLRVSKMPFNSSNYYHNSNELNLSAKKSDFTIFRRYKPKLMDRNYLKAGIPIRLFHKEIEAYLVAEGLFGQDVQEEGVHLRVTPVDHSLKSLYQATSAITYWLVELQEGSLNGDVVNWETQCRIRHMTTRHYLKVHGNTVRLTNDPNDPNTVFRLHAVIKEKNEIEFETHCRIEHAVTGSWFNALEDEYTRGDSNGADSNDMSFAKLKWSTASQKQTTLNMMDWLSVVISISENMQYDDAFTVQFVDKEHVSNFYFMAGMVPCIQKLLKDKKGGHILTQDEAEDIVVTLQEIKNYMLDHGAPVENRQMLFRDLRMVELIVKLIQQPHVGTKDEIEMTKVIVECYNVLYTYIMGDKREQLYIARHINFFREQIATAGEIGLNATHMVMELIKGNRQIVDRITNEHIDQFIGLLNKNKNYRYLDLLGVLCECDGVAIPDNQKYITEKWLKQKDNKCVYYTALGQNIKKAPGIIYVSKDGKLSWELLTEFSQNSESKEDFLFLQCQMDLFAKLCYGRNEFAIDVITKASDSIDNEGGYLTWEEAFLCLCSNELPHELRAKYCSMIIVLFVDVGENTSVLDRVALTYVYDEVGTAAKTTGDKAEQTSREHSVTTRYFPDLHRWISQFLSKDKHITASNIGRNILIEQVLRLVHFLVKYGYYGDLDRMKELLAPMLALLGENGDSGDSCKKRSKCCKRNRETDAVINVKYQAMEVLDLFFNFRFNTRLKRFIEEFKSVQNKTSSHSTVTPQAMELLPLLKEDYDAYSPGNESITISAVKVLEGIFEKSAYFKDYDIVKILLGQSSFEYDKMVVQSMSLLNRYYSAHDNLFKRAVKAQVLLEEKSCEVFKSLQHMLPVILRLKDAKMTDEQTETMTAILDKLISYCHLEDEESEEHPMNQRILYNHEIVCIIFDVLSQDIDVNLMEQYKGMKKIYEKSLTLLKLMARENNTVQLRLFDKLDFMLKIQGAEHHLAGCLVEVFTGNKHTCMKIQGHQIQKIMSLVAIHKDPQLLRLLEVIVKVEELNLPLKKNQDFVMKAFMQFRSDVAFVIDQPANRSEILKGENSPNIEYFICLVDLLATCAEGESKFIESICQSIFSVSELLEILNDSNIGNQLKRPLVRFMLWVFLKSDSYQSKSNLGNIGSDSQVWKYFDHLNQEIQTLTTFVQHNTDITKKLLRKSPKYCQPGEDIWKVYHDGLHYVFDAVLPFLQVFFKDFYYPSGDVSGNNSQQVNIISASLVEFTKAVGVSIGHQTYMDATISVMNGILSVSTLPVQVMEDFNKKLKNLSTTVPCSDARKKYEEYYKKEEELNKKLNTFSENYRKVYGGQNTVKNQIGHVSKHTDNGDKVYTEVGGDEDLPLGSEFQLHMKEFVDDSKDIPGEKYQWCQKLIDQLSISLHGIKMVTMERLHQDELDIKCLQLLRGIVHNEIIKLPMDWEWRTDEPTIKEILVNVTETQTTLNKFGGVLKILDHLGSNNDNVCREVLSFLSVMLFCGNEDVQKSLKDYFLATKEEYFFFAIKNRINRSTVATKERRALISQHNLKIKEAMEQLRTMDDFIKEKVDISDQELQMMNQMRSNLLASVSSMAAKSPTRRRRRSSIDSEETPMQMIVNLSGSDEKKNDVQVSLLTNSDKMKTDEHVALLPVNGYENKAADKLEEKDKRDTYVRTMKCDADGVDRESYLDYKDDGYIELVLRVLGLMCDGQNAALQNYLREQPDNIKSVNLVAEVSQYLALLYGTVNDRTIALMTQLFQTLVEFVSGNTENQSVIFDSKICNYINHILRSKSFQGCTEHQILQLKLVIANLINAMIEENTIDVNIQSGQSYGRGFKDVVEALDPETVWKTAFDCYQTVFLKKDSGSNGDSKIQENTPAQEAEKREFTMLVGFKYYHVLLRMMDVDVDKKLSEGMENFLDSRKDESGENMKAWDHYDGSTMSIEIVKNGELQKLYFRCKDQTVLREEAKEKFTYEVNRSTPSTKLREFMDWSHDIIKEIKYTKRIFANPLSRYFVKFWFAFNMMMITLSFMFFLLIMASWKGPSRLDSNGTLVYDYDTAVPAYRFEARNVKIATWILAIVHNIVTLCVFVSYVITNRPRLPSCTCVRQYLRRLKNIKEDNNTEDTKVSSLQAKIFSLTTFWFTFLLLCSLLGTVFYGYFFAVHLLHVAMFNQLLKRAILAITKNGMSLLWVFIYGIIIIWIYTLVAFAFYRELYDESSGRFCTTIYECFMTTLHRGLIETLFDILEVPEGRTFRYYFPKMIFDLTFFIIITTIGLNIIFGIIVDTFSELRDDKWQVDNDMKSNCFICSRSSYDFEHKGGGFEKHIKEEHNQWAYLFFFIHLDETRINDYTALELYVHRLIKKQKYDFFPLKRALSLIQDEKKRKLKIETVMEQNAYIVSRMKEDEEMKYKEEQRRKQLEWERQHKGK